MKQKQNFSRPCIRCDKTFTPTGKGKICDDCSLKPGGKESLKKQYFKLKEELDILRSDITLKRWQILSKAYKLGKKAFGPRFTRVQLAEDMEMAMTTVLRCLSLDKANKRSWKLVKEGKISVFKLAMITHFKNITYQDEVVDMVVEEKLSTYQITSIKISKFDDINLERHRLAIEKGYTRQSSAYTNFSNWIERGNLFLLMKGNALTATKREEIRIKLKNLNEKIERYLDD